jgi:hypothetical protein
LSFQGLFLRRRWEMSQDANLDHISKKAVVYRIPGMEAVKVRRDVEYRRRDRGALAMASWPKP